MKQTVWQTTEQIDELVDKIFSKPTINNYFEIPISQIDSFPSHPFRVINDEAMQELVQSIRDNGLIAPAIVREKDDGRYELISGHRRKMACELAGLETMLVTIKELDKEAATIIMVDSNMQRESILPSEKSFAYKMKLEALKHQGKTSPQLADKLSAEIVADCAGISKDQVWHYIRLAHLVPDLLKLVDDKKIAFSPAVELSYLTKQEQYDLFSAIESGQVTPSLSQSQKMKILSKEERLTQEEIFKILSEEKSIQNEKIIFKKDNLRDFFPKDYTVKQIENTIMYLLAEWQKNQKLRNYDAR